MILKNNEQVTEIINKAIKDMLIDDELSDDLLNILTDVRLYSHSLEVARYSVCLGVDFSFPEDKLINLAKGALLHDLGKKFINELILYKPGKFTDAEFQLVKQHPQLGYNYIKNKTTNKYILEAIQEHHENIEGTGYPKRILEKKQVVQIITVSDIFSALTEARVYKKAMPASRAFEILENHNGVVQEIVQRLKLLVYDEYEAYSQVNKCVKFFREWLPIRIQRKTKYDFE